MDLNDSLDLFAVVAQCFEDLNIPYQLGGSVASSVHGFPRGTHDVDVEADLQAQHVDELVRRLKDIFIITPEMLREAIRYRGSFNLIPFDGIAKIDVFLPKDRAFDRQSMAQRQKSILLEDGSLLQFYVNSPEDTVLRKLEWYLMGGQISEQKWLDVLGVLKAQFFDIDLDYLEHWARELKISDLLEKALDEAGFNDEQGKL